MTHGLVGRETISPRRPLVPKGVSADLGLILKISLLYLLIGIVFTLISLAVSPPDAQIGRFRPVPTIPGHIALLILVAASFGVASTLAARKLNLTLVLLIPTIVVLTDADHFPSFLGLVQPIRPEHSFVFIAVAVAAIAVAIKRPDVDAAVLSAFFTHLSIDSGVFPPLSPISYQYYGLSPIFRGLFLTIAVVLALLAGLLKRRENRGTGK